MSVDKVEKDKILNMQQQILLICRMPRKNAVEIFNSIIKMNENCGEQEKSSSAYAKMCNRLFHGKDAFAYLDLAEEQAIKYEDQFEEAFDPTNKGFETFSSGEAG